MKFRFSLTTLALAAAVALPACSFAQGMGSMNMPGKGSMHSGGMVAPAQAMDKVLMGQEREFIGLAEALPADKFNFAPTGKMGKFEGVRTWAEQIKHVTEVNYGMLHSWNLPGGKSRGEIEKLQSRDEILAALKDSYQYVHQAIATITPENAFTNLDGKGDTRVGMIAYLLVHNNDHFGQMVIYLRMNGVVPPESRKGSM